jgi:hypothetical protein
MYSLNADFLINPDMVKSRCVCTGIIPKSTNHMPEIKYYL